MRRITKEEAYFALKGKFVRSKDEEDDNKHSLRSLTENDQWNPCHAISSRHELCYARFHTINDT
jgi:hypothetical protein